MLPAATITEDVTPEAATPSEVGEGMLPRDMQQKTAYYDYAAEKQLSQADAKLFYQRSQIEAQKTGGSMRDWENSPGGSPTLIPRSFSSVFEQEGKGKGKGVGRSGSTGSGKRGDGFSTR